MLPTKSDQVFIRESTFGLKRVSQDEVSIGQHKCFSGGARGGRSAFDALDKSGVYTEYSFNEDGRTTKSYGGICLHQVISALAHYCSSKVSYCSGKVSFEVWFNSLMGQSIIRYQRSHTILDQISPSTLLHAMNSSPLFSPSFPQYPQSIK